MAEPLKNAFGPAVPKRIAETISAVYPKFKNRAFLADSLIGYEPLALLDRGRHIAAALARHLPADFEAASDILISSLGPRLERTENNGMAPFFYLPHTMFVAANGLDHFEASLRALYELTQRFTAEMAIRPFIVKDTKRTLRGCANGRPIRACTCVDWCPKEPALACHGRCAFPTFNAIRGRSWVCSIS